VPPVSDRMLWTGWGETTPGTPEFLRQGHPRWTYWLEPPLDGGGADLLLAQLGVKADPLRVAPGQWVVFNGTSFKVEGGGAGADSDPS
jgi:hypothetical protein